MSATLAQHPWLLYLSLLCLGLVVGSFLNVVIYRLPLMMEARWRKDCCELLEVEEATAEPPLTLSTPNSHCPHCKAPVRPWQNVPVISYLLLRGKCAPFASDALSNPGLPLVALAHSPRKGQ